MTTPTTATGEPARYLDQADIAAILGVTPLQVRGRGGLREKLPPPDIILGGGGQRPGWHPDTIHAHLTEHPELYPTTTTTRKARRADDA